MDKIDEGVLQDLMIHIFEQSDKLTALTLSLTNKLNRKVYMAARPTPFNILLTCINMKQPDLYIFYKKYKYKIVEPKIVCAHRMNFTDYIGINIHKTTKFLESSIGNILVIDEIINDYLGKKNLAFIKEYKDLHSHEICIVFEGQDKELTRLIGNIFIGYTYNLSN